MNKKERMYKQIEEKLEALKAKIEKERIETLMKRFGNNEEETRRIHGRGSIDVKIKDGNKYTKVDIGNSGAYMIDMDGNIFGIKAYGQVHKGHRFGTLDTINDYFWGEYRAYKIK